MLKVQQRGGGGSDIQLLVTTNSGNTITITKDTTTRSQVADESGECLFRNVTAGTWLVTVSDGSASRSEEIVIINVYEMDMPLLKEYVVIQDSTIIDETIYPDLYSSVWACFGSSSMDQTVTPSINVSQIYINGRVLTNTAYPATVRLYVDGILIAERSSSATGSLEYTETLTDVNTGTIRGYMTATGQSGYGSYINFYNLTVWSTE